VKYQVDESTRLRPSVQACKRGILLGVPPGTRRPCCGLDSRQWLAIKPRRPGKRRCGRGGGEVRARVVAERGRVVRERRQGCLPGRPSFRQAAAQAAAIPARPRFVFEGARDSEGVCLASSLGARDSGQAWRPSSRPSAIPARPGLTEVERWRG
jgi:hypothetical protein